MNTTPNFDHDPHIAGQETEALTIVAHVRAKRGQEALMIAEQRRLVAATVGSPGCLRYELHLSNTDRLAVTFVEAWSSHGAWQAHMHSAHMAAFRSAGGPAIAEFILHEMHRAA
jgi:quinol monooxygenase YgiN